MLWSAQPEWRDPPRSVAAAIWARGIRPGECWKARQVAPAPGRLRADDVEVYVERFRFRRAGRGLREKSALEEARRRVSLRIARVLASGVVSGTTCEYLFLEAMDGVCLQRAIDERRLAAREWC